MTTTIHIRIVGKTVWIGNKDKTDVDIECDSAVAITYKSQFIVNFIDRQVCNTPQQNHLLSNITF